MGMSNFTIVITRLYHGLQCAAVYSQRVRMTRQIRCFILPYNDVGDQSIRPELSELSLKGRLCCWI